MRRAGLTIVALLTVTALTTAYSPRTNGNTFGNQDYLLLENLGKRTGVFRRDVLDSQRALPPSSTYECMNEIFHEVDKVEDTLHEITALISTSGGMINSTDELIVNTLISIEANHAVDQLIKLRHGINLSAGYCSNSAIVTTKAQYALSLFTEIENALRLIARRVTS